MNFIIGLKTAFLLVLFIFQLLPTAVAYKAEPEKKVATTSVAGKSAESDLSADLQSGDQDFTGGFFQSARDIYGRYVRLNVPDAHVIARMAVCDAWLGKRELAFKEFQQASAIEGDTLEGYLDKLDAQLIIMDYEKSMDCVSVCCQKFPNEWKCFWRLGYLKNRYGDYGEAITAYTKAISLFPTATSTRDKTQLEELPGAPTIETLYALRAHCNYLCDKYNASLNDCTKVIELNPNALEAYESRAEIKIKLHDLTGASDDLRKAVSLKSKRARTFKQLGLCQLQLGNAKDAVATLSVAIKIADGYAEAYHLRARALRMLGKFQEAANDEKLAKRLGWHQNGVV